MSLGKLRDVVVVAAVVSSALLPGLSHAATEQPSVVSQNAADQVPQLVSQGQDPRCAIANPHVDAVATLGDTGFAAGLFDCVVTADGTVHTGLTNLVSFNISTGDVEPLAVALPAGAAGQVWALETDPEENALYVGGDFKTVNGLSRSGLVKLDATTGAQVQTFKPYFAKGKVGDLQLVDIAGQKRLFVAGGMAKKLASLDPATGANDGFLAPAIGAAITDSDGNAAWGNVSVYRFAVDPSRTHLAATGNFMTVDGQARRGFFMLDLTTAPTARGDTGATLSSWYYPGFAKDCTATHPRRIAYLQGVDWSPDGSYVTVTATGQIPEIRPEQVWHWWYTDEQKTKTTVCDGVGRFALNDPTKPVWVNYTGGDSVWVVQDTGSAVYVQGHFRWLDNPDGYASLGIGDKTTNEAAVRRSGIGAIDPATGRALSWSPAAPTSMGGKVLLPTDTGLWAGGNWKKFGAEKHYGLAFVPLAG